MKKILFITFLLFVATAFAQKADKFSLSSSVGTGICMNVPSHTPLECHVTASYHLSNHLSAGIGIGASLYEKMLIPVYATVKYDLSKCKFLTPFASCSIGYGFTPAGDANGGFYLSPSMGVAYRLKRSNVFLSIGYEFQKMQRRKSQCQNLFDVEFVEHLSHHLMAIQIGYDITF
jgi:hypothetical protein